MEDAASSLTVLEQLYQQEQAKALHSMNDAKQRLAGKLQLIQADRDKYKAESEQEHKALLQAADAQQHLQEQIRSGHTTSTHIIGITACMTWSKVHMTVTMK